MDLRKTGDSKMPRPPQPPARIPPQQPSPQRELHPEARDTIDRIYLVWDENKKLIDENGHLTKDNEVLKRVDAEKTALISDLRRQLEETQEKADNRVHQIETHFRERLAESERAKERYLRYAVSISERLKAAGDDIAAAHDAAMDMAGRTTEQTIASIEADISNIVHNKKE